MDLFGGLPPPKDGSATETAAPKTYFSTTAIKKPMLQPASVRKKPAVAAAPAVQGSPDVSPATPAPSSAARFQPRVLSIHHTQASPHEPAHGASSVHRDVEPHTIVVSEVVEAPSLGPKPATTVSASLTSVEDSRPTEAVPASAPSPFPTPSVTTVPPSVPAPPPPPAPAPVQAHALPWMMREDADEDMPSVINDPLYHSFDTNMTDEYDPSVPNDYETLCQERLARVKAAEFQMKFEQQLREQEEARRLLKEQRDREVAAGHASSGRGRGMDLRPAWMKAAEEAAAKESGGSVPGISALPPTAPVPVPSSSSSSKPDLRPAWMRARDGDNPPPSAKPASETTLAWGAKPAAAAEPLSCAVLLRNMVGPGEVDADLESETKEECSKFGRVRQVLVHEIKSGATPEEAVRIFVEFMENASAAKAIAGLNGRFFGGRQVKATYFPMARLKVFDLAPGPNE